jgi:CheY-like chemotaxis protein
MSLAAGKKILICEDEKIIALDLEKLLTNLGYKICAVVDTGKKLIESAAMTKPDIILCDISLRGKMNGIEAYKKLLPDNPVPVIFISAFKEDHFFKEIKDLNCHYLMKPFKNDQLKELIETIIDHK